MSRLDKLEAVPAEMIIAEILRRADKLEARAVKHASLKLALRAVELRDGVESYRKMMKRVGRS